MRILFQGDSITDGGRMKDNELDLNHQIGHSYVYIIAAQLGARYWDRGFVFLNRGISGNRIADLYARLPDDIINLRPNVLSLLIGVNDAGQQVACGDSSFPERFEKIYRMLLDEVLAELPECKIILCEPFILPVRHVKDKYEQWHDAIGSIQEAVSRISLDYPVIRVGLQERFDAALKLHDASNWLWDGIHPTEAGHQILADAWREAAEGLLLPGERHLGSICCLQGREKMKGRR